MERRSKKKKSKKNAKSRNVSSLSKEGNCNNEECIDIYEDMHSIEHYMNDREEMIEQVFSVLEKEKLHSIIPPSLKGLMFQELKEKCLHQLKEMSTDDVRSVLRGESLNLTNCKQANETPSTSTSTLSDCHTPGEESQSSSIKEVIGPENRTLLDILEQELQRIAYETVLNQGDSPIAEIEHPPGSISSENSDDLQVITPSNSSVELVCIDSSEDSNAGPVETTPNGSHSEKPVSSIEVNITNDVIQHTSPESVQNNPTCFGETLNISEKKSSTDSQSTNCGQSVLAEKVHAPSQNTSHQGSLPSGFEMFEEGKSLPHSESFMIQVFPGKSPSSERIVKKVLRQCEVRGSDGVKEGISSQNTSKSISTEGNADSTNLLVAESTACIKPVAQLGEPSINTEVPFSTKSCKINVNNETLPTKQVSEIPSCQALCDIPLEHMVTDQDIAEENVKKKEDSCNSKDCGPVRINASEKEEGEITDEESESDIELVELVREKHRSPTVFLSSDESRGVSDDNLSGRSSKRHRHHRSKKHKKDEPSVTSERQIEKRGNRSYRRKKRSTSEGSLKINDKKEGKPDTDYPKTSRVPLGVFNNLDPVSSHSGVADDGCTREIGTDHQGTFRVPNAVCSNQDPVSSCSGGGNDEVCTMKIGTDKQQNSAADKKDPMSSRLEQDGDEECTKEVSSGPQSQNVEKQDEVLVCSSIDSKNSAFGVSSFVLKEPILAKREKVPSKASWADRWAEKQDLKRVVSTSKIYTNVRKKILSERNKKKEPSQEEAPLPPVPPLVLHVEGSVQEYQMLQWLSEEPPPKDEILQMNVQETAPVLVSQEEPVNNCCTSPKISQNCIDVSSPSHNVTDDHCSEGQDPSHV